MPLPFEEPFEAVQANLDSYADAVIASLESEFLAMPKGEGFVEYQVFEQGYEALKRETANFLDVSAKTVQEAVTQKPIALVVLRSMLGFSPPEWAYAATQMTGCDVPQGAARSLDRAIRLRPESRLRGNVM